MSATEDVKEFFWFHSIDLGGGLITPGSKSIEIHRLESAAFFDSVNLNGKSVLDIGAWNGYYSFEAKRRGAARVVASDSPTWMDPSAKGHAAFSFARAALGLEVEDAVVAVENMSPELFGGQFDVVLFLGVFYHMRDPLLGLSNAARLARNLLIVETHLDLHDFGVPAMRYYVGDELGGDPSNYWGPNPSLIIQLLKEEGFSDISFSSPVHPSRGIFHARR